MHTYRVYVFDNDGVFVAGSGPDDDVVDAAVGRVTWELNGEGSCDVTIPVTSPDVGLVTPGRELRISVDALGSIFQGPITRKRTSLAAVSITCQGWLWYFSRRSFGRADRVNLISNGDFETGETGWSFFGGVTHAVNTARVLEGTHSLQLTGTGAADQFASHSYSHTAQYSPGGDLVTVAAYAWIDDGDYVAPNPESAAMIVEHRNGAGVIVWDELITLDDDTLRDGWVQFRSSVPAVLLGETVDVHLYAPEGVIHWDLVTFTLMESLANIDESLRTIIRRVVLYAQDRGDFTHGKSNLNIDPPPSTGTAGPTLTRVYQFSEHRNIGDSLNEFVRNGQCDLDVDLAARAVTLDIPRKGSPVALGAGDGTLRIDVDIADAAHSWNGEAAASSVVSLGPGDGPDRPEGGAVDPAGFDGLTLETVEVAPDTVTIGELDGRAANQLVTLSRPEVLEVTGYPQAWLGSIETGDVVTVEATIADVVLDGSWRVVGAALATTTDQLTLTLNPE